MSLTVNDRRLNHLTDTLVRLLQHQKIPGLSNGIAITTELLDRVRNIVRQNLSLLVGSTLTTAGLLTILPSLIVTIVNILGFTAGGVLKGSIAALIQGTFYAGGTSGLFSIFQAFGATAVISPPVVVGIGATLALVGAGVLGYHLWRQYHVEQEIDQDGSNSSLLGNGSSSRSRQVIRRRRQRSASDFDH